MRRILTLLFRKFVYYSDIVLWARILAAVTVITLLKAAGREGGLVRMTEAPLAPAQLKPQEKISRYVDRAIRVRAAFGFRDFCFTHSLLLCRLLRLSGHDARLNFGVSAGRGIQQGHCWVSIGAEPLQQGRELIFRCP